MGKHARTDPRHGGFFTLSRKEQDEMLEAAFRQRHGLGGHSHSVLLIRDETSDIYVHVTRKEGIKP